MKVLLLSYYAPPLGLSGVVRITKFSFYLKRFGINPCLLTVRPIAYYHYDYDLLKDLSGIKVYRAESLDLARLYFIFFGKKIKRRKRTSLPNLLFPDAKISFLPFAYQTAKRIIEKEKPSLIFATSPPWTCLLLGVLLKRRFLLPLISDFRDPWPSGFIPPSKLHKRLLLPLLSYIAKNSDFITFVQRKTGEELGISGYHLPNGYDLPEEDGLLADNLLYTGNLFEIEEEFLSLITNLSEEKIGITLALCGGIREDFLKKIKRFNFVRYFGFLSHKETGRLIKRSRFLLYLAKPNQEAGIKLYEYLGAKRPIIYLGPEGTEAEQIIRATDSGVIIRKPSEIKEAVDLAGKKRFQFFGVEDYSFVKRARELAEIMRSLVEKRVVDKDLPGDYNALCRL
uniref:Glycosyltransferase n=1 Tax=candidate division WOR-3 bacterium TaxID=2052148 RepID=A0A7C3Z3G4_UNCW3